MLIQGTVQQVKEKATKAGYNMYDLVIDGKGYGVGKFPPKGIVVGDYVKFEGDQNGSFWNVKPGSLSKIDKPAGVAAAPARSYGGTVAPDRRQETISKQAALNSALAFVKILVDADALPIAKAVKTDKKVDALQEILNEYTAQFYHQSTGDTFEFPDQDAKDLASLEQGDTDWSNAE